MHRCRVLRLGPGPVPHPALRNATAPIYDQDSMVSTRVGRPRDTWRDVWWDPRARAWWIAVLFMVGSACFAVGAAPGYATAVGVSADSITFFVGSLFFTSAALLQFLDARTGARLDRWASSVQLAGTLFFNLSTGHALITNLSAAQSDQKVWRPDAFGSVCFLVASELAFIAVGHAWISWRPRVMAWWIAFLNMVGSIAFGVSAVASYVIIDSGLLRNAQRANAGTFVGALCFLAGAFLLLPNRDSPNRRS